MLHEEFSAADGDREVDGCQNKLYTYQLKRLHFNIHAPVHIFHQLSFGSKVVNL